MSSLTNDIHPIVCKENFSADFDYELMAPSLRLFTRILDCPQSLHHYYVLLYGKNKVSPRPLALESVPLDEAPQVYACSKGINELTKRHKTAVRRKLLSLATRLEFVLVDTKSEGETWHADFENGMRGSRIRLNKARYDLLLIRHRTRQSRQLEEFNIAVTLLHELAHAAPWIWFGEQTEHFFENSIIAEAGFEYEARVFGLTPVISRLKGKAPYAHWVTWQQKSMQSDSYDLNQLCCDQGALPGTRFEVRITPWFVTRLFTDHFWNVTMQSRGPLGLIDESAAAFLDPGKKHWARQKYAFKLPQSILDLYEVAAPSYAARAYRALRNPHMKLRRRLCDDADDEQVIESESGKSGSHEKSSESTSETCFDIDVDE